MVAKNRRMDRKEMQTGRKHPSNTLVGLRGWCKRIEAGSRKEQTKLGATEEWRRAKSSNNKEIKSSFINRYFGTVRKTELEKDGKVETEDDDTEVSGRHIYLP